MRPVPSICLLPVCCAAVQAPDPSRLPPGRCGVSCRQPRGFPFGDFDLEDVMLPEVGAGLLGAGGCQGLTQLRSAGLTVMALLGRGSCEACCLWACAAEQAVGEGCASLACC